MNKIGFGSVALVLLVSMTSGCNRNAQNATNKQATGTETASTGKSTLAPTNAAQTKGTVAPEAVDALKQMSAYLTSLKTLGITSNGSMDVVTNDGQRIQLDGVTKYKVRKPGFVIDFNSDLKKRQFYYDGKTFAVYSPATGMYATAPAPATNREALQTLYDRYGIALPLEDLFRWADADNKRQEDLKSAYQVGTATIDGVETNHYAFREGDTDWELWVQQGDKPLPKKVVIIDRTDPTRPTFTARLNWQVNPSYSDRDFTFVPGPDAKRIQIATYKGTGG